MNAAATADLIFGPSRSSVPARFLGAQGASASVVIFRFVLSAVAGFAPSSAMGTPSVPVEARRLADASTDSCVLDAGEMVQQLRAGGLPVSAIADVVDVERKTVYAWEVGNVPQPANAERLRQLHEVLSGEAEGTLRFLHRLWERRLPDGSTLRSLLLAPEIDVARARTAVEAFRPAAMRAMGASRDVPFAGGLVVDTAHLEAVASR